jgi:Leucine-rich repeat (LRR) protein
MSGSKDLERFSLKDTHQQMQSVIGRKRKDAKHGDNQQYANAQVLAMRQILRPRTPTPSQRSSQQNERPPLLEIDIASEQTRIQQEKLAKIQAELDAAGPLRSSTASGVGQKLLDDSRKGSVTTQDFLDEAKKIMAGIRGKARPRSGLTSVEESESEIDRSKPVTQDNQFDASCQESTQEPFSRPPSREGGARIPRLPLKQEDPVLLNHLRKYQEMSGIDGIIGSSVKSIAAAREAVESAKEIERMTEETISRASGRVSNREDAAESDPPHIHISENPEMQRKRKHSGSSARTNGEDHPELEFPSHGSNASSGQSTTRSIPTGSSRNSDSRRVIAPHTVSHLIPEQVAGMIFDRGNNIWVKQKSVNGSDGSHYFFLSDESEDDPFGDIPDLSVDETQELKRIKEIAAKRKEDEHPARIGHSSTHVESIDDRQQATQNPSKESVGALIQELEPLEPSKLTYSTSDGGAAAANNTSVISCDEILAPNANQSPLQEVSQILGHRHYSTESEIRKKDMEEAEREISINEGRLPRSPRRRRRNVTISFSSPIASVIEPSLYEITGNFDDVADEASPSDDDDVEEDFGDDDVVVSKRGGRSSPKAKPMKRRTAFRSTSSLLSVGIHRFSARPVSRIDECEEESCKGDNSGRKQHISVIVSTPVSSTQISRVVAATSRPIREIGTLSLTPMSEFTEHHADETFGLEVSYIGRGQTCVSGSSVKSTLSLSIKELVEKLTEVEPYEPRWGNMKQIQMNSKGLTNLHKLDEFCEQIENLDVSSNQISQLNGVPKTLRNLRIAHNYLSDLTAWGHLRNLQYIDVSNNELETLSAFCPLVHLRELRADNNKIKSLDGIGNLDGLLSLRMRGNLVESLDFAGTKLWRLTDLDLRDNRIHDVKNIHYLRCLSSLDLENNELSNFSPDVSEQLCSLKYLKLSGNGLQAIDVSQYPNLRLLYLDQNRLATVTGILKTKHLDSLSLRQQRLGAVINPKTLDEAFEVRKLFLSGNLLDSFRPRNVFLNLQYLELANCGCESIPMDFGQIFPNIRVLNLNFNALKDIKPLLGIVRLKKLHLAGNRLSRLRKTTNVLAKLATLTLVDLRSNPLTQGFYSQVRESRLVKQSAEIDESDRPEPFTLDRMDNEKDMKYSACLDMDTRMLRRVYEMLVIGGCTRLRVLDGLTVDRSISSTNDKVWEALLNAGILEVLPFTPKAGD